MGLRELLTRRRRREPAAAAGHEPGAVTVFAAPVHELAQAALEPPAGTPPRTADVPERPASLPGPRSGDAAERAVIRAWAREHGMVVSDRGRIPARVLEAYRSAQ